MVKNKTKSKYPKHFRNLWLPIITWALVIFLFSSYPTNKTSEVYWQDFVVKKTAHIVEYFIFFILFYRAVYNSGVKKTKAGMYSLLISVFYAISDEFHQSFTPGREPAIRDVVFDTIGALLALYTTWNILPKVQGKLRILASRLQII